MTFVRSAEQDAIVDRAVAGDTFKVPAFAGTGKTTTLLEVAAATAGRETLYLAYNTAMADAARRRFRPYKHVTVKTPHSLAFGHMKARFANRLENSRMALREAIMANFGPQLYRVSYDVKKAADVVLATIETFQQSPDPEISERHALGDLDVAGSPAAIARVARDVWTRQTGDDADLPVSHDTYFKAFVLSGGPLPYDALYIDECQDSNAITLDLASRQTHAQRLYVGDEYQSLYGFRGAVNAVSKLPLPAFPLTQSWRFGSAIADTANFVLWALGEPLTIKGNPAIADRVVKTSGQKPSAILARSNAGVFEAALRYAGAGSSIHVMGGADELLGMVMGAFELKLHGRSTHPAYRFFHRWTDLEQASRGRRSREYAPYVTIVKRYAEAIPNACAKIRNAATGRDDADIVISNVHKSKGLEYDIVEVADDFTPFCTPHPVTHELIFDADEANVQYVMLTRAQRVLALGSYAGVLQTSLQNRRMMLSGENAGAA